MRYGLNVSLCLSLGMLLAPAAPAQLSPLGGADPVYESGRLPVELQPHARALGERLRTDATEQVRLGGEFVDGGGNRTDSMVTIQLPGLVRLDGMRADDAQIRFDGSQILVAGVPTDLDRSLIETFAMDSPEGLLGWVTEGAGFRLLGRGFGPDPSLGQDGPSFDIFEITGPVKTSFDRRVESRRYFFDSVTRLLVKTRYMDANGRQVETRFANWGNVDGSMYPGLIERYEADIRVFSFLTRTVQNLAAEDVSTFR